MSASRKKMDEDRDLPEICLYCEKAALLHDQSRVLCAKRGVVGREYSCRKFRYDPLKRVPNALPPLTGLEKDLLLL